jgi:predicted dehydrogenase
MNPLEHIDTAYAYGIAAREKQRAANFAKYFKIPKVYNDYQSLIDSDEIDSVYIPLANHLHYEWVIKCAKAKKHILVEKPICLSKDQLFEIKEVVEKNRVHLLEGIMVQHHPWQQKIIDMVNSDNLGKICSTKTEICFQSKYNYQNYRFNPASGGGIFWDVASYWLQFLQKCIGSNPFFATGRSLFDGPNGIDQDFYAEIEFNNHIKSTLFCSLRYPFIAQHTIEFENGKIVIGNFLRPAIRKSTLPICLIDNNNCKKVIIFKPECYYTNQLSFFIDIINGRKKNYTFDFILDRINTIENIYLSAKHDRR